MDIWVYSTDNINIINKNNDIKINDWILVYFKKNGKSAFKQLSYLTNDEEFKKIISLNIRCLDIYNFLLHNHKNFRSMISFYTKTLYSFVKVPSDDRPLMFNYLSKFNIISSFIFDNDIDISIDIFNDTPLINKTLKKEIKEKIKDHEEDNEKVKGITPILVILCGEHKNTGTKEKLNEIIKHCRNCSMTNNNDFNVNLEKIEKYEVIKDTEEIEKIKNDYWNCIINNREERTIIKVDNKEDEYNEDIFII